MDNQNTNQINGDSSNETLNQNSILESSIISSPFKEEDDSSNSTIPVNNGVNAEPINNFVSEQVNPNPLGDNITPIKPTLDSILNASNEVTNTNPIEQTIVNPVSNEVNQNTELSNQNIVEPNATQEIVNNISNDAVIDNSASLINEPVSSIPNNMLNVEPVSLENNISVENTVDNSNSNVNSEPISNVATNINEVPIVENIENISIPVVENIPTEDTLNESSVSPIENAEPITEEQTPVDDFEAVPTPPVFENEGKKDKKKNGKGLVIILIIILIAAIGFGLYYFLNLAKTSATNSSIETKELKLELGQVLPTNIDSYANITGYDKNSCTINTNDVNINKVGTSKYSITCGKTTEEGIIIVDDTTAPKVVVNDLIVSLNSNLNTEDFIESCVDASSCSYAFITDVTSLTAKLGDYEVEILVSDEYNNQTIVKTNVTVSRTAPASYLTCSKNMGVITDISANLINTYKIGIDSNDAFFSAVKSSEFSFNSLNDYNALASTYNETVGINGISGTATFNEQDKTITIKNNFTLDDLNKDLNGTLPNNSIVMRAYFSGLGYTCN